MSRHDVSLWIPRGLYLFGVAFILTASIDLFTTVWPMRPGDIQWRYGFLGLAAGYLQTPTLGLVLIIVTALWQEHAMALKVAGFVCLLFALSLLGAMGIFGLDVVQIRPLRAEEIQSSVLAGGIFQEVKYFVAAVVLAFLGHGSLKSARSVARSGAKARSAPGIVSSASPG